MMSARETNAVRQAMALMIMERMMFLKDGEGVIPTAPPKRKRTRALAPQGFHATKGPRVPQRKQGTAGRREYKRRKRARKANR
jgi:hypothetical protein